MVWNVTTLDDGGWGFKKLVILAPKKKVVLLVAPFFYFRVKLTYKCSL